MKLGMQEHTDVSVGVQKEVAVSFEANAVAFYAQISGLAKDKIGYPIREICTNAWDASRGNFEVNLPTSLNPVFRVRDFGTGMTPEQMEAVYAKMYASTKRDSNEAVGGWGLGRFSPFAYLIGDTGAGSYNVTSYTGGMMRAYVLSVSSGGNPMMRLLAEVASDEPSGLEVSVPIRRDDISSFRDRARQILWSFSPRPTIAPDLEWREPEIQSEGEGWASYNANTVPFTGPHVRMGCVMYPIDLRQVETSGFLDIYDTVVFDAPIGSLRVTLSREELAYDTTTKQTLKTLIAAYETSFISQLQAKVNEADTYFKACQAFEESASQLGRTREDNLRKHVSWNGMSLRLHLTKEGYKAMRLGEGWGPFDKFEDMTVRSTWPINATVVLEHNPSYSFQRFQMAELIGKKVLWVRCKRAFREHVLQDLGNPEVVDLDTFKVPLIKRDKKTIRKRKTLSVTDAYHMMRITQDVDLAEGGYYVEAVSGWGRRRGRSDGYRVSEEGTQLAGYQLENVLGACLRLGIIDQGTVILVRAPNDDLGDNWTMIGPDLIEGLKASINVDVFTGLHRKTIHNLDSKLVQFGRDEFSAIPMPSGVAEFMSELRDLIAILKDGSSDASDTDVAFEALKALGGSVEIPNVQCPIDTITKKWESMKQDYPLLDLIVEQNYWGGSRAIREMNVRLTHYFSLLLRPEPVQIENLHPADDDVSSLDVAA